MSIFNQNLNTNTVNVLNEINQGGGGLDTLAELDAVITQLNIETNNTNGNVATLDYVNSLVISSGSYVSSDPVLISSGNISVKYDNSSLILNTSGQLRQNDSYLPPTLRTSGDVDLFGGENINFKTSSGTLLSTLKNTSNLLNISTSNLSITGNVSIGNCAVSNLSVSNLSLSGSLTQTNISSNNSTISNLLASNSTITNLLGTNTTISNILGTNSTISNLLASSSTISNLSASNSVLSNASIGNSTLTTSTIGTLINTNSVITNASIGTSSLTNVLGTNTTINNLLGTNSTLTNLLANSSTLSNQIVNSSTTSNAIITNLSLSNLALSGSLIQTNIQSTNSTITNLLTVQTSTSDFIGTNNTLTSLRLTNGTLGSFRATASTIGNIHSNNIHAVNNATVGSLVNDNLINTNASIGNLKATSQLISTSSSNGNNLSIYGGGGLGSVADFTLSTYDPGANDATSRIRALDNDFSSHLLFQTKTPGSASNTLATRMFIKNDGNIGINTTAPSARLTVVGDFSVLGNSAGGAITNIIGNNAPETSFTESRFISVVSNTNKFSNISTFLATSGSVAFQIELSRTSGSNLVYSVDPDRLHSFFRYNVISDLDVLPTEYNVSLTSGSSLGLPFFSWNRLYLKGNSYVRNIYARTTGQLIGTDDSNEGYRFNILANNITSNNIFVTTSTISNLLASNSTISNLLASSSTISNLIASSSTISNSQVTGQFTILKNTGGWSPGLVLRPPVAGDENYMYISNSPTAALSSGSYLLGKPSGTDRFEISYAGLSNPAFCIRTSGNVSINTNNPRSNFHVNGDQLITTSSSNGSNLLIYGGGGGGSVVDFTLSTYDPGTDAATSRIRALDSNFSSHLLFQTKVPGSASNALNTRMFIQNDGNVSIGTNTAPSYLLTLSSDSAAKPSTSSWTVSSDERLKTNITTANLDICYDNVKNLPLKRYTWKDSIYTSEEVPDRSKLGWIAQDVEQFIPKAVEQKDIHGYSDCRTLNTDQIIASLYGAVQKLMNEVEKHTEILDIICNKSPSIRKLFNT